MKYFAESKSTGTGREITKKEALDYLKSNYVERVCTFEEMLSTPGRIPCMFSNIIITE